MADKILYTIELSSYVPENHKTFLRQQIANKTPVWNVESLRSKGKLLIAKLVSKIDFEDQRYVFRLELRQVKSEGSSAHLMVYRIIDTEECGCSSEIDVQGLDWLDLASIKDMDYGYVNKTINEYLHQLEIL